MFLMLINLDVITEPVCCRHFATYHLNVSSIRSLVKCSVACLSCLTSMLPHSRFAKSSVACFMGYSLNGG